MDNPTYRVLVVDDSPIIHAMYKSVLRGFTGVEVAFVKNGKEALDVIDREGEPALIFLDVNMPVMDGFEMLHRLRERGATERVAVVMVTTESTQADVDRAITAGAVEYVTKPFRREDVAQILRRRLPAGAV